MQILNLSKNKKKSKLKKKKLTKSREKTMLQYRANRALKSQMQALRADVSVAAVQEKMLKNLIVMRVRKRMKRMRTEVKMKSLMIKRRKNL